MTAHNHIPEATLYTCSHCIARFPDRIGLNRHLKRQHGLGPKGLGTVSVVDYYCNSIVYSSRMRYGVMPSQVHAVA